MTALLPTLEAEADAVMRFVDLLKREQIALGLADIDKLTGFTLEKSGIANELNALADQRNATLASLGQPIDRPGMESWFKQQPTDIGSLKAWSRILSLASEARELNRLNGELIQIRIQHNAQALNVLQSASQTLHLYGPNGQSAAPVSRRINDAA